MRIPALGALISHGLALGTFDTVGQASDRRRPQIQTPEAAAAALSAAAEKRARRAARLSRDPGFQRAEKT